MKRTFTHFLMGFLLLCSAQIFATTSSETESNNLYTEANTLVPGDTITGAILGTSSDIDWFAINTDADGLLSTSITVTGTYYVYITIYDNDGITLLTGGGIYLAGSTHTLNYYQAAAGDYFLSIRYYNSTTDVTYSATATVTTPAEANDAEPNGSKVEALDMIENSSVEGHIGYRYNGGTYDIDDWYKFETTNDGTITLNLSNPNGNYYGVFLYDSNGTLILDSDYGYGFTSASAGGLAAGTYYARVYYYSTTYRGGYTLENIVTTSGYVNDTESNDTPETALEMAQDASTTGHINFRKNGGSYDTYDWYKVITNGDGTIKITMVHDGYFEYVRLYDSDGTTPLGSEVSGYAGDIITISVPGLAAGTYFIRVAGYSSFAAGYTLSNELITDGIENDTESNDTPETAFEMAQDASTTGHINFRKNGGAYDVYDWYEVNTNSDGTLKVTMVHNGYYAYVRLFDNDGSTALSGEVAGYVGDSITVSVPGLAAGTYLIRVAGYSSYAAGYTLFNTLITDGVPNDTEPNDTPETALNMNQDDAVTGHINFRKNGGAYDVYDWYEVNTNSDGTLKITMVHNGYYAYVRLYDNDGVTALGGEVAGYVGDSITVSVPGLAAGTYFIRVRGYSSHAAGYTLINALITDGIENDTESNDTYTTAQAINTNTNTEGHINFRFNGGTRDTYDYYAVTLNSSGDLSITVTHNAFYAYMRLYNTDGTTGIGGEVASYGGSPLYVSATDLAPGTYYIRVRGYSDDAGGYTLTNNFCPDAITIIAEGETTLCEGESVILSTADHHLSYLWSDGSTTETNAAALTGEFSLTIDNGGGCVRSSNTLAVDVTPNPVAILLADGPTEFCAGGSVTLSADIDVTPDAYLWSTGETTATIEVSETGDYSLELFKGSCSAISDPIAITVNANPVATITPVGSTTFCEGGSVTLNASAGDSYLWSNGETASSIVVDASGDYSVEITNAAGCSDASAITTVTVNANPTAGISADGDTEFCEGGSVNLTASGGTSYLWNTGATTASINVTETGDYSCTVSNAAGCDDVTGIISVTVNANPVVEISADGPTTFCIGGSVNLSVDSFFDIFWSTGETTESIDVTEAGAYSVSVTDANGCSATSDAVNVVVEECGSVVITADGPTTFCAGGSVTLTSSEESGNIWSTGETTQSIVVTESGDYSCENGVNTSNTISVTVNSNPVADIAADGPTTFCDGGSVNLTASGGTDYLWSTGEITATINAISDGDYSCVVTNDEGCSDVSSIVSVIVNANPVADISADGPTTFCEGGSVNLTASGGTDYLWSTGETTATINVITTGDYSCLVSNAAGCSDVSSAISVIAEECGTEITISAEGATEFCNGESVVLTSSAAEGNIWSTGETTQSIEVSTSGDYYCSNGAFTSNTISVSVVDQPSISVEPVGPDKICFEESVMLSAISSDGALQWYRNGVAIPGANGELLEITTAGLYSCSVDNGICPVANSNEVKITYFKGPEITPSGTSYVCPGGSIILSSPYSASATYQWYRNNNPIPGAVSNTYEATIGGKYFVVITRDGCGRVSGTAKIIMDCRLTDDNELSSLIYPNPASTSVNIITDGQQGDKIEMVLCDINGRIVLQQYYVLSYTGEEIGLSLFDLANGIYNLQLRYPNGTINQHPLVINK